MMKITLISALATSMMLSIVMCNYGMENEEVIIEEGEQGECDFVRLQERKEAVDFFSNRYVEVNSNADVYDDYAQQWNIWDAEEREVQAMHFDSPIMQEQCAEYQKSIAKRVSELRLLISMRTNVERTITLQKVMHFAQNGEIEKAKEELGRVSDAQDRELLVGSIAHHEAKRRSGSSVGPLHCAISLGMISCAAYGFYKLCQSLIKKETSMMPPLEELIAICDEHDDLNQDRAQELLHRLACQLLACIDKAVNKEQAVALRDMHARIIELTAQHVTRDQLIEIVKMIKNTVA